MSASELQSLVAPIALYPDALVAQVLGASTFPDQVAIADYWVQQNKTLTGTALTQAVDKQTWDPSVKALTQFPSVLHNLAQNLAWTSSLGEAYHNQSKDVMAAIQTLRAQAKSAGSLKSGSQITVVQQTPQTIVIQPTNPQVVYVPQYNPTTVYGAPVATPDYSTADVVGAGLLGFGAGIAVGALASGGGWGYPAWGCSWGGGAVVYNNNNFYGNNAWHGGYYNTPYNNAYNNYRNGQYNNGQYNNAANRANNANSANRQNMANQARSNGMGSGDRAGSGQGSFGNRFGDSDSSRGWGDGSSQRMSANQSAFGNWGSRGGGSDGGWGSRSSSARGWGSRGGGGGWGGRGGGGGWGGRGGGGFGGRGGGGFRR